MTETQLAELKSEVATLLGVHARAEKLATALAHAEGRLAKLREALEHVSRISKPGEFRRIVVARALAADDLAAKEKR